MKGPATLCDADVSRLKDERQGPTSRRGEKQIRRWTVPYLECDDSDYRGDHRSNADLGHDKRGEGHGERQSEDFERRSDSVTISLLWYCRLSM